MNSCNAAFDLKSLIIVFFILINGSALKGHERRDSFRLVFSEHSMKLVVGGRTTQKFIEIIKDTLTVWEELTDRYGGEYDTVCRKFNKTIFIVTKKDLLKVGFRHNDRDSIIDLLSHVINTNIYLKEGYTG